MVGIYFIFYKKLENRNAKMEPNNQKKDRLGMLDPDEHS